MVYTDCNLVGTGLCFELNRAGVGCAVKYSTVTSF